MKMILIIFQKKKKIVFGKWTILGPILGHPHDFGSAIIICCKFCTIKRANRQMKVIIMVCIYQKRLFRANGSFCG